jgi:hypothetical protein
MTTVGFREIYRYGGRFVGYLLVVGGLAGAFVVAGGYLASRAMDLTDPSVAALGQTQAALGVALMAVGVVLGAVGLLGLAHKLLTESLAVALAAAVGDQSAGSAETPAEASVRADEDTVADRDQRAGEATDAGAGAEPQAGPEPGGDAAEPTPAAGVAGRDGVVHDASTDPEPAPAETAEEAPGDGTSATGESADESPDEWTPPDPSEFESPATSGAGADQSTEPRGAEEAFDEPAGGTEDPEAVPDDETLADEGVDSFRPSAEDDPLADRLPSDED